MNLTTKGRYAVTAMLDLALRYDQGPIALADVTERQDISLSYLEQLFARLRREGLVVSVRGPGGGYRLNRHPSKITIVDIIEAIDEKIDVTRCAGEGNCQNSERCLTHNLWEDLSDHIHLFLEGVTLERLADTEGVRQVNARQEGKASLPQLVEKQRLENL